MQNKNHIPGTTQIMLNYVEIKKVLYVASTFFLKLHSISFFLFAFYKKLINYLVQIIPRPLPPKNCLII